MFEMFKMQELKSLDDDECNRIWEFVAGERLAGERIKPIRILTGGNPRLLTIIAKFGAHRSFRKLLDDLVHLIDDHTEYFKSHLDNLPAIERKAYLALAGLWDASTAREVARAARLDVNKTSALLRRLIGRGAVVVEDRGKKVKWYSVAERMYNIYYLMRRRGKPADRVKATVKFMISMYDPESAARLIAEEAIGLSPEICNDHYLAYEETIKQVSNRQLLEKIVASTPKSFLESPYFVERLRNIMEVDHEQALKEEDIGTEIARVTKALTGIGEGLDLVLDNKIEEGMKKIDCAGKEFPALVLFFKGLSLGSVGQLEECISTCGEMFARFADEEDGALRGLMSEAIFFKALALYKLNKYEEAEKAFHQTIERNPDHTAANDGLIKLLLKMPERLNDALKTAEEIIIRKPKDAHMLDNIAWQFYKHGDLSLLAKAEKWSRKAVSLEPEKASFHLTLACILSRLGKREEALNYARRYIQDAALVESSIEDAIELFVAFAAAGHAKEAIGLLVNSPARKHLEPLEAGLKLFIGEDVKTAPEILEIAKDVAKRIEDRVKEG